MISLRDRFIAYTVLLLGAVVALYPLWSIFNLSISETKRIEKSDFNFLGIYFGNYFEAWNRGAFDRALLSSLFVSTFRCSCNLALFSAGGVCPCFDEGAFL